MSHGLGGDAVAVCAGALGMRGLLEWYSPFWLRVTFATCRLLYGTKVFGAAAIPPRGPVIFVVNHSSKLESSLLIHVIRRARADAYVYGGGGPLWSPRAMAERRFIPAPRGVGQSGPSLWAAFKLLRRGHPILMAPEGAISWDGRLKPLQPGAAWLALRSQARIVVCVLRGGYSVWPRWAGFPRLAGRLEIRIAAPLALVQGAGPTFDQGTLRAASLWLAEEMARVVADGWRPAAVPGT